MTEPIEQGCGVYAAAIFASNSNNRLYGTVQSYESRQTRARDLAKASDTLSWDLGLLLGIVQRPTDADLSALELPLLQRGKACEEVVIELVEYLSRASSQMKRFRDWDKVKLMGYGIDGLKRLLFMYGSTVNIALTDANLPSPYPDHDIHNPPDLPDRVINEGLQEFKNNLAQTTAKLETHGQDLMDQSQPNPMVPTTSQEDSTLSRPWVDQEAARQCVDICSRADDRLEDDIHRNEISCVLGIY